MMTSPSLVTCTSTPSAHCTAPNHTVTYPSNPNYDDITFLCDLYITHSAHCTAPNHTVTYTSNHNYDDITFLCDLYIYT